MKCPIIGKWPIVLNNNLLVKSPPNNLAIIELLHHSIPIAPFVDASTVKEEIFASFSSHHYQCKVAIAYHAHDKHFLSRDIHRGSSRLPVWG